jgi:hypothetical protein
MPASMITNGLARVDVERFFQRRQQFRQFAFQRRLELFGFGQLVFFDAGAQAVGQMLRGFDADVGGQQHGFQFFEQGFVDFRADAEQAGNLAGQCAARAGKALFESLRPGQLWRCFGSGLERIRRRADRNVSRDGRRGVINRRQERGWVCRI